MMKPIWFGFAAGVAVLMAEATAGAATATSQFNVTLTIASGCGIELATDVNFGLQSYIVNNLTAQGSVTVACTDGLPYTLALDGGQSNNVNARKMANNTSTVNYQLYQDAANQVPWGNQSGNWVNGTGTGLAQVVPVYGLVPGPQSVVAGNYVDTITVTIAY